MKRLGVLVLMTVGLAAAADEGLERLRVTVQSMRGVESSEERWRGATSQWTVAKHQLRDWVEQELKNLDSQGEARTFEATLNNKLRGEGLLGKPVPGFLNAVRIVRKDRYLVLITGLGITCGYDESVYLYDRKKSAWRRVLQSERTKYSKREYEPRTIVDVYVDGGVVLTVGQASWCSSYWHPAYWQVFRLSEGSDAKMLLDESASAYLGGPSIRGSLTQSNIFVEFNGSSLDADELIRTWVRRYRVAGDSATRVDPIALRPSDFVEEWILAPWSEAKAWTQLEAASALSAWHGELRARQVRGVRANPTKRCEEDTWQVAFDFEPAVYFQVRREAPDRFRMAAAGPKPFAGCTQDDPGVEEKRRLLSDAR